MIHSSCWQPIVFLSCFVALILPRQYIPVGSWLWHYDSFKYFSNLILNLFSEHLQDSQEFKFTIFYDYCIFSILLLICSLVSPCYLTWGNGKSYVVRLNKDVSSQWTKVWPNQTNNVTLTQTKLIYKVGQESHKIWSIFLYGGVISNESLIGFQQTDSWLRGATSIRALIETIMSIWTRLIICKIA